MKHYIQAIKNYASLSGRASRTNYWMFVLFNMLFSITALTIDAILGTLFFHPLYTLFVLIPSIAIAVRRLHDINRTGWWYPIVFIPLFGAIVLLVFFCMKGTDGENKYGTPNSI